MLKRYLLGVTSITLYATFILTGAAVLILVMLPAMEATNQST